MTDDYSDMWVHPDDDPRERDGVSLADERATVMEYLRTNRLTFEMKCADLTPEQLATRSVEPSTMSLLGLLRHLAKVERSWTLWVMRGRRDVPRPFTSDTDRDLDFHGAVGDPDVVAEAWREWRAACADTDAFVSEHPDMSEVFDNGGDPVSQREVLVHLVEEYGRHNGHADLLRERVDGRTGQ